MKSNEKERKRDEKPAVDDLKQLWPLLFKDWILLSDEEIGSLLKAKEEIGKKLYYISRAFPDHLDQIVRYREKKKTLRELSKEELLKRQEEIQNRIALYLRSHDEEDISDSFFEPPPMDSDENVIGELLEECKV